MTMSARKRVRFQTPCKTKSRTKQQFKDATNINNIMKKYRRTGTVPITRQELQYVDNTELPTFRQRQHLIIESKAIFERLPSELRLRFENDPANFFEYLQNPDNLEQMEKDGFVEKAPPLEKEPDFAEEVAKAITTATKSQEKE
ncbi:MAG: internal scaffolding protein [Microviridae sp.]|nr:MAG: internal scaffolding protein [Microviridae sp.]